LQVVSFKEHVMNHRLLRVITPLVFVAVMSSLAYGQVTTALSGTVTDTSGAVLPGADVVAKADDRKKPGPRKPAPRGAKPGDRDRRGPGRGPKGRPAGDAE